MNKLANIGNGIQAFFNWIYAIPPASFQKYEVVLIGFVIALLHLNVSAATQAQWLAVGLAVYGVLEAVAQLSKAFKGA